MSNKSKSLTLTLKSARLNRKTEKSLDLLYLLISQKSASPSQKLSIASHMLEVIK